jgi:hypothetical protein
MLIARAVQRHADPPQAEAALGLSAARAAPLEKGGQWFAGELLRSSWRL